MYHVGPGGWQTLHPREDFTQPEPTFLNLTDLYFTVTILSSPQNSGWMSSNRCTKVPWVSLSVMTVPTVWWPSIGADITSEMKSCDFCAEHKPTQSREPLVGTLLPSGPRHRIAGDLCELNGKNYLIVVDYFSWNIEIAPLTSTTNRQVISKVGNSIRTSKW